MCQVDTASHCVGYSQLSRENYETSGIGDNLHEYETESNLVYSVCQGDIWFMQRLVGSF